MVLKFAYFILMCIHDTLVLFIFVLSEQSQPPPHHHHAASDKSQHQHASRNSYGWYHKQTSSLGIAYHAIQGRLSRCISGLGLTWYYVFADRAASPFAIPGFGLLAISQKCQSRWVSYITMHQNISKSHLDSCRPCHWLSGTMALLEWLCSCVL